MNRISAARVAADMSSDHEARISRRAVLAAGVAGAGAAALAACGGGSVPTPATQTPGQRVTALADIPVGQAIAAHAGDRDVIVARPTASTVRCFSAVCTHQGCIVQAQGTKAVCPCHGSVFDALNGQVIRTPAPAPLESIGVRVQNGQVVTT